METGKPDLSFAKKFAEAAPAEHPDQLLVTTAARRSTGSSTWTMTPRCSRTSSARWASPSSSSPWPASTPSTTDVRPATYGYAREQMKAYVDLQEREFAPRSAATLPPHQASARSVPATSTRSPPPSTPTRRPRRSRARPKRPVPLGNTSSPTAGATRPIGGAQFVRQPGGDGPPSSPRAVNHSTSPRFFP